MKWDSRHFLTSKASVPLQFQGPKEHVCQRRVNHVMLLIACEIPGHPLKTSGDTESEFKSCLWIWCYTVQAALADHHRLGRGLNNRNVFLQIQKDSTSKGKVLGTQFLGKARLLAMSAHGEHTLLSLPLLVWTTALSYEGPAFMTFSALSTPTGAVSKYSPIEGQECNS